MPKCWVYDSNITHDEALIFYNALIRHNDPFYYYPIAVAKREETGTKYRFLCIARPKNVPAQSSHFVGIEIYKPILGMPYATCLHKLVLDLWNDRI